MAAGLPDAKNIGQDRQFQDPEEALRQQEGTYSDAAQNLPEADKANPLAGVPETPPFTING